MLLLSARASSEIVEAIEASAESFAKAMEANTKPWNALRTRSTARRQP